MISDFLLLANPWWQSRQVSEEKAKPYKREAFGELMQLLGYKQVVVLTGLRRVGKSTLLFQLIRELLKKENEKRIVYFNFDEKNSEPLEVLKEFGKLTGTDWKKEKCFAFFDEIQKVGEWSSKIKFLYDNLPNLKIFVSGSASLMLEAASTNNLAGRHFLREIKPLSLKEFAELCLGKKIERTELYREELERIFPGYLKRPFPEIVKWEDEKKSYEYVKELVLDKVLKIDLPQIFKVNVNLLSTLSEMFLQQPGMILNLTELAKELRTHKITLEEHIYYLEFAKVIRIIKNFRPSIRAESRKMKKIYPFHIALSYPFYPQLDKGRVFETIVATEMKNYWRKGNKEIDFIKREPRLLPIEAKAKMASEIGNKTIDNTNNDTNLIVRALKIVL